MYERAVLTEDEQARCAFLEIDFIAVDKENETFIPVKVIELCHYAPYNSGMYAQIGTVVNTYSSIAECFEAAASAVDLPAAGKIYWGSWNELKRNSRFPKTFRVGNTEGGSR